MRRRSSSLLRPVAEKWAGVAAVAGLAGAGDFAGAAAGLGAGFPVWAAAGTARDAMRQQRTSTRMAYSLLAGCSMRHGPGRCQDSTLRRYSHVEWRVMAFTEEFDVVVVGAAP